MSIPKKQLTKSRKQPSKSTKQMPADCMHERSKKPEQSYQLFDYAVANSDLQRMVGKTILDQFTVFAARFQLVADLTANPKGEPELPQSSLEQIKQIASESKRSDYRRIMKAIEAAAREGGRSIYRAQMTAIQAVHMYFRFEAEYLSSLVRYEARLRSSRAEKTNR